MQMVGHYHKFMQEVGSFVAAGEDALGDYFRDLGNPEDFPLLPSVGGNEVRAAWGSSVSQSSHGSSVGLAFRAEAPLSLSAFYVGAKAPTP